MGIHSIRDVVEKQLCCGCGACAYVAPNRYHMGDAVDHGRRPFAHDGTDVDRDGDAAALRVCPGVELEHRFDATSADYIGELLAGWGPILEMWEGYASDAEVRYRGSSGGAATALSLWGIERGGMHGVLHSRPRPGAPFLNETVLSQSRDEVLAGAGSRYAPASPCDGLGLVEAAPGPCVFVGKPCDVGGLRRATIDRPALDAKVGLAIGFFCAGTPSTRGTLEMLRAMGIEDPTAVRELRYRGHGWPGRATAVVATADGELETRDLSYEASWGDILQKHRQWRCHVCLDHTGEFADIAVGDPWYRDVEPDEPGRSLILVRTERGRERLGEAVAAGYLTVEPAEPWKLPASQKHFAALRGQVWARRLVCRLLGAGVPRFRRMPMARFFWRDLSLEKKIRALLGTVRRVFRRGLRQRAGCSETRWSDPPNA